MINVLVFSPTGGNAGVDVCLDNLVSNLDQHYFRPVVLLPKDAFLLSKFQKMGIQCYELPLKWWFPIGVKGCDLAKHMVEMRDNIGAICDIIHIEKIDLILSNSTVSLDACIAGLLCKVKHIFFMHAAFVDNIYTEMSHETKDSLYRFMGKASEEIICCSNVLADEMNLICDNIRAINNGIDTHKFIYSSKQLNNGDIDMVSFGHFNANKQQKFVLDALRILKRKNQEAYSHTFYTAIGPGEQQYLSLLKTLVEDYGLDGHVIFEDFEENVQKRMRSYNLYVNSSITETMPLSVMEAMSSGLPVLCTHNNGNIQIVRDGIDGMFCASPEEMADNIALLLENPNRIHEMSINARKRIEELFSVERYVKEFESHFKEIHASVYGVDEEFRSIIGKIYSVFEEDGAARKPKVLTVYDRQAVATYAIAAERPLEFLSSLGLVDAKGVEISSLSDRDIERADAVFLMRFYTPDAVKLVERFHEMGKSVIWYIDDNYLGDSDGAEDTNPLVRSYLQMFKVSDCVVVNNKVLFGVGKNRNDRTFLLPTYQYLSKHDFVHQKPAEVIRFGFMGTLGRDGDFVEVEKAIKRIIEEFPDRVEVEFIGYCPESLKQYGNVRHFEFIFDYTKFRDFFEEREWDFAIAPLANTSFNRSKTNNKYREYASFAIPAVFSNISTYTVCVQNEVNGLLVENECEDWYRAICRMINEPSLRERLGRNAYEDVAENYKLENYADPLYHVICIAMRQQKTHGHSAPENVNTSITVCPSRAFTSETRKAPQKRCLFRHRTEARSGLRHIAPMQYYNCLAFIPGIERKKMHFSEVVPYEGYFEYSLRGYGNNINLFLVSDAVVPCYIEIVENQKIVYGETRLINGWSVQILPVGALDKPVQIRLKCMSITGIVRTIEYSGRWNLFKKPNLLAWIS